MDNLAWREHTAIVLAGHRSTSRRPSACYSVKRALPPPSRGPDQTGPPDRADDPSGGGAEHDAGEENRRAGLGDDRVRRAVNSRTTTSSTIGGSGRRTVAAKSNVKRQIVESTALLSRDTCSKSGGEHAPPSCRSQHRSGDRQDQRRRLRNRGIRRENEIVEVQDLARVPWKDGEVVDGHAALNAESPPHWMIARHAVRERDTCQQVVRRASGVPPPAPDATRLPTWLGASGRSQNSLGRVRGLLDTPKQELFWRRSFRPPAPFA